MGLKKPIELNTEAVAEYWRISSIVADRVKNRYTIQLDGYVSQAGRIAGKKPITHIEESFYNPDTRFTGGLTEQYAFVKKEILQFNDAIDVLNDPKPELLDL